MDERKDATEATQRAHAAPGRLLPLLDRFDFRFEIVAP